MTNNVLGKPYDRVDGKLKVTGQAMYSGDRQAQNLAHGYLLTSTVARGTIVAMDTGDAERAPGVVAVFSPFNSLKLYRGLDMSEGASSGEFLPPIQDRKILNYGQIIGLIVADSFEQARDATPLIKVQCATQDPVASLEAGMPKAFRPESVGGRAGDN